MHPNSLALCTCPVHTTTGDHTHLVAFGADYHFFLSYPLGGENLVRLANVQRFLAQEVRKTSRHRVSRAGRRPPLREKPGGLLWVVEGAPSRDVAERAFVPSAPAAVHCARFFSSEL